MGIRIERSVSTRGNRPFDLGHVILWMTSKKLRMQADRSFLATERDKSIGRERRHYGLVASGTLGMTGRRDMI